jgi:hypothetical protein
MADFVVNSYAVALLKTCVVVGWKSYVRPSNGGWGRGGGSADACM